MWFHQVEAQFATRNPPITADLTKFNHVVAALDNVTAGEDEAIILSPPTNDKYEALKAALIDAFGRTQASKDMELLSLAGLGDRKPSSLLHYMESLNADPKTLLRTLFLAQLPIEVRRVLAGSPTSDLKDLAKEADAIIEAGSLRSSAIGISGVHNPTSPPPLSNPRNFASTTANLARMPGDAINGVARWPTWSRLPQPSALENDQISHPKFLPLAQRGKTR